MRIFEPNRGQQHAIKQNIIMKNERLIITFLSFVSSRSPIRLFLGMISALLITPAVLEVQAQTQKAIVVPPQSLPATRQLIPVESIKVYKTSTLPQALALSVHGQCDHSEDGNTFTHVKAGHVFNQGAVIRTGKDARIDLFFRRIGTTVRLQPDTEMGLEKMSRDMKDGMPVMETLLDLRKGRIFVVVRSLVEGSTLEIRNAAGRSVVEGGGGKGRYIITADGTHVTDKGSAVPLKVIGEKGITVIEPGQQFLARDGKLLPLAAPDAVTALIDFDELDSLSEQLTAPEESQKAK